MVSEFTDLFVLNKLSVAPEHFIADFPACITLLKNVKYADFDVLAELFKYLLPLWNTI